MDVIRTALVGLWHVHAGDHARDVQAHPEMRLEAVWGEDRAAASAFAAHFGAEAVSDLDDILARPDIDAIVVTTATERHEDVITRSLAAGKHVFTEKVLATTEAAGSRLIRAADAASRSLVVALPRLSEPSVIAARNLIAAAKLGTITYARVSMFHDGWVTGWLPDRFADTASAGGGALTDLGCHPLYLLQQFLGPEPESVSATLTDVSGHGVEDNAVVTVTYANGAIGVAETSFVAGPGALSFELRGTHGTAMSAFGAALRVRGSTFGDSWVDVPLPTPGPTPLEAWADEIRGRATAAENRLAAVRVTRLLERAMAAAHPA